MKFPVVETLLVVLAISILLLGLIQVRQNGIRSTESFQSNATRATLYYFYMPWCKYCQEFNPMWDSFIKSSVSRYQHVTFKKMNMEEDTNQFLGKKYKVTSYPTILLVKQDGETVRFQVKRTEDNLHAFLDSNV